MKKINVFVLICTALLALQSANAAPSTEDLVKQSNNPMADIISFPFQMNYDQGSGEHENGNKVTINVQPVIPISVSDSLNILSRTILPLQYADNASWGHGTTFGIGDTVQSFFIGPKTDGIVWGVGPAFMLPTATTPGLSMADDRWSAGPAAIIAYQNKGWTLAAISYQVWSFAGPTNNGDVNFLFFQPIVTKSFGPYTVGMNSEIQRDWEHHTTIVPLNLIFNKMVHFGKLPVTVGVGAKYYLEKPEGYSKWGARFVMTFFIPESILK